MISSNDNLGYVFLLFLFWFMGVSNYLHRYIYKKEKMDATYALSNFSFPEIFKLEYLYPETKYKILIWHVRIVLFLMIATIIANIFMLQKTT